MARLRVSCTKCFHIWTAAKIPAEDCPNCAKPSQNYTNHGYTKYAVNGKHFMSAPTMSFGGNKATGFLTGSSNNINPTISLENKVIGWLIANGFTYLASYLDRVMTHNIVKDPLGTVKWAQDRFTAHNMFFSPWDDEDEKTKIAKQDANTPGPWNNWQIQPQPIGCQHEWKEYLGLNEKFTFCKKCDIKKEE